ncbi:MAG: hypothetical protein ACJAXB_002968 [Candidatus Endobugula sp.]|jgi:hypothetical protein
MRATGLLFLVLLNSSCISIIEKYIFNRNEGGEYIFTVDLKEMTSMMEAMGSMEANATITNMISNLEKRSREFEKTQGVPNAKVNYDEETSEVQLSFAFSNMDDLNQALSENYKEEGQEKATQLIFFTQDKNKISRKSLNKSEEAISGNVEVDDESMGMMKMMMSEAFIKTIMEFDTEIKSVSNKDYELSSNKRSIEFIRYLFKDEDQKKKIETTVALKK